MLQTLLKNEPVPDRLYNRSFKLGFALTIAFFVAFNFASLLPEHLRYLDCLDGPSPAFGYCERGNWGFPFDWFGYHHFSFEEGLIGLVLNFTTALVCAIVGGLLVRYLGRRSQI